MSDEIKYSQCNNIEHISFLWGTFGRKGYPSHKSCVILNCASLMCKVLYLPLQHLFTVYFIFIRYQNNRQKCPGVTLFEKVYGSHGEPLRCGESRRGIKVPRSTLVDRPEPQYERSGIPPTSSVFGAYRSYCVRLAGFPRCHKVETPLMHAAFHPTRILWYEVVPHLTVKCCNFFVA